ncbi:unnamed protein product [Parnassius mnemosyne]|uniref:Uncharacterized protein n=1 Tax=Parnassius mnemosyne TaxID=213953 RepID=A0AAV1LVQ6_9NEOP
MKLIKQPISLSVSNINIDHSAHKIKHSILLPNTIRCIICGPSNCGKTNVVISLLLHENGLKFQNLYLYSKTNYQPKYRFLREVIKRVPNISFYEFNDNKDVIGPSEALNNSVFIFDDVACENQINIRNYFSMGRHKQIDYFYLSQTYSKIPKQLLRDNGNFIIIFKQDDVNLKHIYEEHVSSDMSWNQFKNICNIVWSKPYNFVCINKDSPLNNGRYRKNFDIFFNLE